MPLGLNETCHCVSLDEKALQAHFDAALARAGSLPALLAGREHLFAPYPVFASRDQLRAMQAVIEAAHEVMALPAWREEALRGLPWPDENTRSVLMGFDFHPQPDGAKLIEINTNAGGAYLAALQADSQRACCEFAGAALASPTAGSDTPRRWFEDFLSEWRLSRGDRELRRALIVDENPEQQFLYPEFLLFRGLFRRQGMWCEIADPRELGFEGGTLRCRGEAIDLVYNRLTDFTLSAPENAVLRKAYLADAVVLTPSPRHHALYADKRHLVHLADEGFLERIGASAEARRVLAAHVPRARLVTAADAEAIWNERKRYFFKPFAGYGSRGAYRGDRMTRRVWEQILASGGYIAQEFAAPPTRRGTPDDQGQLLKFDLRCVSYGSEIRLVNARLYQGQTTNLRTASGGLGSVFVPAMVPENAVV